MVALAGLVVAPAPRAAAAECNFVDARGANTPLPWSQRRLQPERVWNLTTGNGIVVAVIDSGVDARNPHLTRQVIPGADLLRTSRPTTTDCSGHGTMVAGIIVGRPLPGTPFHGVAPAAKVLSIRQNQELQGQVQGTPAGMARAIVYAVNHHAKVINISATTPSDNPALRQAVQYALRHDVLIVAAAGNDDPDNRTDTRNVVYYPAAYPYPNVLAVAGIDEEGNQADVSHSGRYVDVAAPGKDVISTYTNGREGGRYAQEDGTSFAAPFVSGVAALVRAYRPELSAAQVAERIKLTADPPPSGGTNAQIGAGVVNPYTAVTMVLPSEQGAAQPTPQATPRRAALPGGDVSDHTLRNIALAATGAGGLIVFIVLALVALIPRGKERGWRPGRRVVVQDDETEEHEQAPAPAELTGPAS